jgi:hypothetical protein
VLIVTQYLMDPFNNPELRSKSKLKPHNAFKTQHNVGAIRYSFLQLRSCKDLTVEFVLWTGKTAGQFALEYLLTSSTMQKKKKTKKKIVES